MADIRLSDRIFAPRYVAAMPRVLISATPLREAAAKDSPVMMQLQAGAVFEVFDLAGGSAWGIATGAAPDSGLVGYIDASALGTKAAA